MNSASRKAWIAITAAALAGMALIAFSTRLGPGVGGDATIYITSARNLLAGKGLGLIEADGSFRLLPYSTPFFPLILAALQGLGFEIVSAARWLNILLFGGLIFLAGGSAWSAARSAWAGIGAAFLIALSPILSPVYSWSMAEPLTLLLGFAGLWAMGRQIERPQKIWPLILAAVLTGLAALARYSAAAFTVAAGLAWLLIAKTSWRIKITRGIAFGVVAMLPSLVWVIIQLAYTSSVASRSVEDAAGIAARLASFWPQFGSVFLSWLIPASWIDAPAYPRLFNSILTWVVGLSLVGLGYFYFRKNRQKRETGSRGKNWTALLVYFILVYFAVIFGVYLTTYPPITLDNRMFSPLHASLLILVPIFVNGLSDKDRAAWLRWIPILAISVLALWYGWRDVRIVRQNYDEGLGYNSVAWRSSDLIEWVKQAPPESKIITNEAMAVLYLTGRTAYPLAEIYADKPQELDAPYGSSSDDEGQRVFREGGNPLVLFDSISAQLESIYRADTPRRVEALTRNLEKEYQGNDGMVFFAPK